MQLGASTTLTIDESMVVNGVGAPSKVGLAEGALHSVIKGAMRGSTTTFEVHTPNAVGAVRGTDFTVRAYKKPQCLFVLSDYDSRDDFRDAHRFDPVTEREAL